jgi:hypothetical protein
MLNTGRRQKASKFNIGDISRINSRLAIRNKRKASCSEFGKERKLHVG